MTTVKTILPILPTSQIIPWPPPHPVEILLFGRNGGETDWSIAALGNTLPTETAKPATLPPCYEQIANAIVGTGVSDIFAPRPSEFNAIIVSHKQLTVVYKSDNFIISDEEGCLIKVKDEAPAIHRGWNADGCDVPKGAGFWISSSDCPVITAYSLRSEMLICAHAGRDSLFDRGRLETGKPSRRYDSVVDAIMESFRSAGDRPSDIRVFVALGIGPENFPHPVNHPKFGAINKKFIEAAILLGGECVVETDGEKCFDLHKIISQQFQKHGVNPRWVKHDAHNTWSELDGCGRFKWWSAARDCNSPAKSKRNGVLVVHHLKNDW